MLKKYTVYAQVEDGKESILEDYGVFEDILERTFEKAASDLGMRRIVVLYPRKEQQTEKAYYGK